MALSLCQQIRRNLLLDFQDPRSFVDSEYLPQWFLWCSRIAMALTCFSTLLYTAIDAPVTKFWSRENCTHARGCSITGQFFLVYLTIWSYIVILAYFCTALASMTALQGKPRHHDQTTLGKAATWCLRIQWLLSGIACNAALVVTVIFNAVLLPSMACCQSNMGPGVNTLLHICNLVFMLLEVATSGLVVRPVHCIYTMVYGLAYELFSLVYWIPDHSRVIYPVILDWNHPLVAVGVFLVLALVAVPLVNCFWWLVYAARRRLVECFLRTGPAYQRLNLFKS